MVIVSKKYLKDFVLKHSQAALALNYWYDIVSKADWRNFADIKQSFNSVDFVGNDRYVFNIKGNDFRLIGMIFFNKRTVYIRFIGTHSEYDKLKDCSII